MDNQTDYIMDETVHIVDELFTEYLNDETCNMKLFGILETLGKKSSGFTYALCNDGDGKLSGFVWMTSVMRSNFEKFSQYISVDAMKRKTNENLFPYMAIVVTDDMNKVQVCCEALIFS